MRSEVADWDDDMITAARFKAFTGQRQDWESRYQFWKHLIVCVARHLDIIIIDADEVRSSMTMLNILDLYAVACLFSLPEVTLLDTGAANVV